MSSKAESPDSSDAEIFCNHLACAVGAVKLKGGLGNINAQYANCHVHLPSKVEILQSRD
jgi:hypothetical protein